MSNPTRLLITTPNLDTAGSKYVIADIIRGLDRSLVLPSLCVHRLSGTPLEQELREHVEDLIEIPLRVPIKPLRQLVRWAKTVAPRFRGRYDVVHSLDYASNWSEGVAVRLAGIPWITQKTNMVWGKWHWWVRGLLAKRIVCYSDATIKAFYQGWLFKHKTISIHTGVKLSRFTADVDVQRLRDEMGTAPESIVLGCVAHLVPVKGHPELLHAFAKVAVEEERLHLVLIGTGEEAYRRQLEQLTRTLGISACVHFLGERRDVPRLLPGFDGFVLATRNWGRREAFGAVLVEAMATELPVIATKSGGPEEIVVPGETGWLVEADGSEPLAHAMRELVRDAERRRRFGKAGRQRTEAFFSSELMVQQYQNLYREVAA